MVQLTDSAVNKVKDYAAKNAAYDGKNFRVFVQGGGCNGFSYGFAFDDKRDDDQINKSGDVEILLDPQSAKYLDGSRIDYVEDFQGAGFVVENPNVKGSCGCGDSVSF